MIDRDFFSERRPLPGFPNIDVSASTGEAAGVSFPYLYLGVLFLAAAAQLSGGAEGRPNIVLIIGDDISIDDHGAYGHPHIRTPNLDALAAAGLRLTNAYLTTPQCSPSRSSIITGRYPHNTGAPELHMGLPEGQTIFPRLLRESGYFTAAMGKWHLGEPAKEAFDLMGDSRPSGAERWVKTLRNRPKDRPFFMWFASIDAHRDWQPDPDAPPHDPSDAVAPPYMVDGPETREDLAKYMDEVQRLDRYVGEVVSELERQGILDQTLLIYMADNGRAFPRDKAWLYDGGIKTPFILHWPRGLKERGMVSDSLISAIDIAPTLLEVVGIQIPDTVQGVSFSSLFRDPVAEIRAYAFAELNWHTQYSHMRAFRWNDYLYIRNAAPEFSNLMMAKIERGYLPWKDLVRAKEEGRLTSAQANIFLRPRPEEELYDVAADPHQLTNLIGRAGHRPAWRHLREVRDRWEKETGDSVPAPSRRTHDRYSRETGEAIPEAPFSPERRDWPGKATGAEKINEPGPTKRAKAEELES